MVVRTFEIYLHMLRKDAQREYLDFQGVKDPSDLNADIMPIATVDVDEDALDEDEEIEPSPDDLDDYPAEDELVDDDEDNVGPGEY